MGVNGGKWGLTGAECRLTSASIPGLWLAAHSKTRCWSDSSSCHGKVPSLSLALRDRSPPPERIASIAFMSLASVGVGVNRARYSAVRLGLGLTVRVTVR